MFQDAYVKMDKNETKVLVESLKPFLDGGAFDPSSTIVMWRHLPFYKESKFVDMADHRTMPPARRFVILVNGKEPIILDFTNAPIYGLNGSLPIRLTPETVLDYARFFFSFVRGRHGRFLIIESVDDIPWREEPAPAARKAVGKMIAPLALLKNEDDGIYHLNAHMLFKDSLFQAKVDITPDGQVKITEEELLIEDIPVIDDTLGQ